MEEENVLIPYKVTKWSSFSANYLPENILVDKPNQQSSRWSSENNYPPQFLILKLVEPAIVSSITFGKYIKTHVCNLKKFKVLGGLEENNLNELLQGGLKNDNNKETFCLKYKVDGQSFPCRYIKIVPLLSWGASFNFSIWSVQLHGITSPQVVHKCLQWYYKFREREAIRLCLKHFRQHNYLQVFETLQKKTKITLEDPLLSDLHSVLVHEANFEESEKIIETAIADDYFSTFISQQDYKPCWEQIVTKNNSCDLPGMRGGHQMCMDHVNNTIYLLGGWSGTVDLANFWRYSVEDARWTCLSLDTSLDGGPSARSCHKMCVDCTNGKIYTLGRYLDSTKRSRLTVGNDFHVYDIKEDSWKMISNDVAKLGGPRLIFDHQMCFDETSGKIFIFGGRILSCSSSSRNSLPIVPNLEERPVPEFSGLYSYHVDSDEWTLLREDSGNAGPQDIRSRIGHSMLLDTKQHRLYIFGGQRSKEYVNDFFYYDIDKDEVTVLMDGARKKEVGLPPSGFTQRATINSEMGEIYMLSGLSKDREKREETMHNSFWVYVIRENRWTCVYKNEVRGLPSVTGANGDCWENMVRFKGMRALHSTERDEVLKHEPCPRYAHQLVYDHVRQMHYMFGGNPGKTTSPKLRLDDFWCLTLSRPTKLDILRKCRYLIRRQQFRELAVSNPASAIQYLQIKVSETVDHQNQAEASEFQDLTSTLFGDFDVFDSDSESERVLGKAPTSTHLLCLDADSSYVGRTALFDTLVKFFPEEMTQPRGNLVDLIQL